MMNEKFLDTYNRELYYLRELGTEFAKKHPITAKYLSLNQFSYADPYVERLLEGFAFLSARVLHKLESEFPRFTQSLINNIYPHYFIPVPAISIAEFIPDFTEQALFNGIDVLKGTILKISKSFNVKEECKFRTAHTLKLWPIKVTNSSYNDANIQLSTFSGIRNKASICIDLELEGKKLFKDLSTDYLDFYIRGNREVKQNIYKLIFSDCHSVLIQFKDQQNNTLYQLELSDSKKQIKQLGFDYDQSLLINDLRVSQFYRNIQEYFSFTDRFYFFRIDKINDAIKQINSNKIRIYFALKEHSNTVFNSIDENTFKLNCTPIINIFKKHLNRISFTDRKPEYLLSGDNFNYSEYEVLHLISVKAFDSGNTGNITCKPFYSRSYFDADKLDKQIYYTINRIYPDSLQQNLKEKKEHSDLYISFVDFDMLPSDTNIKEIEIEAYCSNGNLPSKIIFDNNSENDFILEKSLPIKGIKNIEQFSCSYHNINDNTNFDWQIINHLKHNHVQIFNENGPHGAMIIQDLLKLYAHPNSLYDMQTLAGIKNITTKRIKKRKVIDDQVTILGGIEVTIEFYKEMQEDARYFILGSILDKFFKNSVPINTFVETVIKTEIEGEVKRWNAETF